jgi:hypothetical protein
MSKTEDPMIAALLREREGYVAFKKRDRLKAVDAELKRRGYEEPKTDPHKQEPKGRAPRESTQVTADSKTPTATTARKEAAAKRGNDK